MWRFKTEDEFVAEYGESWRGSRARGEGTFGFPSDMNYLLGRPISDWGYDGNHEILIGIESGLAIDGWGTDKSMLIFEYTLVHCIQDVVNGVSKRDIAIIDGIGKEVVAVSTDKDSIPFIHIDGEIPMKMEGMQIISKELTKDIL